MPASLPITRDHADAVAHERVELGEAVAACAVAAHDPDLGVRPAELRAEREARADAERAEYAGIEPPSGARGRTM